MRKFFKKFIMHKTNVNECLSNLKSNIESITDKLNLRKKITDAEEVDYPAYGVTGPNKDAAAPTGDRNLAHSAQMYHYQHQKQQIVAMEKTPVPTITRKGTESGSEEDDFTVYECPGLAPVTGEMEVKNPMFQEEENVKTKNSSKEEKTEKTKKTNSETKKTTKK